MNIFPGLSDPAYVRFLQLAAAVLLLTGGVLMALWWHPATRSAARQVWRPFAPWLIMLPLVFLVIGLPQKALILALFFLSIFSVKEFSRATGLYADWGFVGVIYAGIAGLYAAAWWQWYSLFMAMPVYVVALLLMIPAIRNAYEHMLQKVALGVVAVVYLGWFPAHLAFLGEHPHRYALLLFIIIGTEWNDASAYVTGKMFGRRPLVSRISPGKTREGTLGAFVLTSLYVAAAGPWVPGFGWIELGLSVIIIWIGGTMGDLVISFVKRDVGVKDMGALIPGHGGLLDRVDSLIFVAPLYFHMVNYYVRFPGGL